MSDELADLRKEVARLNRVLEHHERRLSALENTREPSLHERLWDSLPTAEAARLAEEDAKRETSADSRQPRQV